MIKLFSDIAWEDYTSWIDEDRKVMKKINTLLKDVERNPFDGLGKPEPLRNELSGYLQGKK